MEYSNEIRTQDAAVRSLARFKQTPEYDALLHRELRKARLAILETYGDSIRARRARLRILTIQTELRMEQRSAHEGLIALPRA